MDPEILSFKRCQDRSGYFKVVSVWKQGKNNSARGVGEILARDFTLKEPGYPVVILRGYGEKNVAKGVVTEAGDVRQVYSLIRDNLENLSGIRFFSRR
ncbi:MAG: hypothetical protein JRJ29_01000 [Deltaproteobacteria bacterium]|nr:hypothetical protein [Deltaproteobacteria bacterium]